MSTGAPLTDDVIGALSGFFLGGAGPRHSLLSDVLRRAGYFDGWVYGSPDAANKETRVRDALFLARRQPARARELVEGMLSLLRADGAIGTTSTESPEAEHLRLSTTGENWVVVDG